jgi:hypothetical protein
VWRDAIRNSSLDRVAKLAAFVLSTYMNGVGECFPGKALLANGASLNSIRSVDRAINRLESARFIIVVRSSGGKRIAIWLRPRMLMQGQPRTAGRGASHRTLYAAPPNPAGRARKPRTMVPPKALKALKAALSRRRPLARRAPR